MITSEAPMRFRLHTVYTSRNRRRPSGIQRRFPSVLPGAAASAGLLAAVFLAAGPARADVLSEMNRFWQGAAVNTTGPTAFQGQASGHWTLGNLYLRAPVRSEQIATVSLPSFRAGCGGIDAFAGAFSFINSDQLVAFARAVAQNAVGFAFELALETISPVIAETMAKLRALAQWVNSQNLNSCETAQALVGALWSKNDRASAAICAAIGTGQGIFSDYAAAKHGCGAEPTAHVEEEGPAVPAHQVERPAGEQHDLRGPPAFLFPGERPGDLGRAPAVDEQQVAGERDPLQRVDSRPGGGDERAVRGADVPRDRDGGVEQAAAFLPGGRDARHGVRFFQLRPGALARLPLHAAQRAGPFHLDEPRLDFGQQVRLRNRPGRAAHA